MNPFPRLLTVVAACCLIPVGAAAGELHLSKKRVVQLADAAAKKGGYDLRDYERPEPHLYDAPPGKPDWVLLYEAKPGFVAIGNRFFVHVLDQDGSTKISPGR